MRKYWDLFIFIIHLFFYCSVPFTITTQKWELIITFWFTHLRFDIFQHKRENSEVCIVLSLSLFVLFHFSKVLFTMHYYIACLHAILSIPIFYKIHFCTSLSYKKNHFNIIINIILCLFVFFFFIHC